MLTVQNRPIMVDEVEILELIRERVKIEQDRDILSKIKRSGNNIMICCPSHKDGQERKPSCGVSLVEKGRHPVGTVHCLACGFTATFEKFVSVCFGINDDGQFGTAWLLENFVTGELADTRPSFEWTCLTRNDLPVIQKVEYVKEEELQQYRQFYHPYMWRRRLTQEIVEKYDVGYQEDFRLVMKQEDGTERLGQPIPTLTFPVRDINGNCLFVSRRAIYTKQFFLPLSLVKPVYGIYELDKSKEKEVYICESVINALTCAVYGSQGVALFGTGTEHQYEVLANLPNREFIIGLDPDSAGRKGAYKLYNYLKKRGKLIQQLVLPEGKDINDLEMEEFLSLPRIAM